MDATLYSLSTDPPPETSRRSDERHVTLFRVGAITIDGKRELCLVKNISAGGALIRAYCALEVGQALTVEIKERVPVRGRVRWARSGEAGIQFNRPVDVLDLLSNAADELPPRMPRVEVDCIGLIRNGAVLRRAKLHNISQGGLSAELSGELPVGAHVTVSLSGLPPQCGVVRWQECNRHGVAFNTALGLPVLVQWLQGMRERAS